MAIFRAVLPSAAILLIAALATLGLVPAAPSVALPALPELRASNHLLALTLRAGLNADGRNSFFFEGQPVAPTLRLHPGDQLKITYINDLPANPRESCAIPPCHDMTNLHFHGLAVSPLSPQDDVLDMMASPGNSLSYTVHIPPDHPPGLYWYHTHPHGESHRQVLDGMSGAIVIEGMESYVPELSGLPERIFLIRGRSIEHDPDGKNLLQRVHLDGPDCASAPGDPEELFTLNGALRPQIGIAPGQRQFWRVVNASADRYVDLQLPGASFEIVAMDGMPIGRRDPAHPTRVVEHVLLPPAGRVEAVVAGPVVSPSSPAPRQLISRCVDTGRDGDPNPALVLADVAPTPDPSAPLIHPDQIPEIRSSLPSASSVRAPSRASHPTPDLAAEEKAPPRFVATFTEDKNGFYINQQKFALDVAPMVRVKIGTYQHWKIINATGELHPMHIHQVHFLAFAENDRPLPDPIWLDTVNVAVGGSVDVIMDFSDPIIKGMSVFHCHLLNHEDKGMMAKILFE